MLIKQNYLNLIKKHYYLDSSKLPQKVQSIVFINMSYKTDTKKFYFYQLYIYFFLYLFFGVVPTFVRLHQTFRRFNVRRGQPMGIKLNITSKEVIGYFLTLFNKWYYYNIFGELKSFFFNKKKGNFFGLKLPFLNVFYVFDYNMVTFFLFNLRIPNLKIMFYTNSDKYETLTLKNEFGLF